MTKALHSLDKHGQTVQISVLTEMINKLVASGYDAACEDVEGQPQDNRDSLKELTETFGKLIPSLYDRQLNLKIEM